LLAGAARDRRSRAALRERSGRLLCSPSRTRCLDRAVPTSCFAPDGPRSLCRAVETPFGRPEQFPPLPPDMELVAIPGANHMFGVESPADGPDPLAVLTGATIERVNRRLA